MQNGISGKPYRRAIFTGENPIPPGVDSQSDVLRDGEKNPGDSITDYASFIRGGTLQYMSADLGPVFNGTNKKPPR